MNNDIAEIRKAVSRIAEHDEFQSRISKWSFILFILIILCAIVISVQMDARFKGMDAPKDELKDWYDVSAATRKGDLKKALHIADELLLRTPLDFDGHYKKGEILLMMGDKDQATESFKTAARIFPMPKFKAAVDAVSSTTEVQ
jgi:tetratricopeptide (TPR) repeat protein